MPEASILVVDDNPANLKLMRFLLTSRGFDVRTAEDAVQTRAVLEETLPDLVLMDIQLPGVDGLTLTRELRQAARTKDLVVVAVTAYAMKGDEERAREAGVDGYITKPISKEPFLHAVNEYLAVARSRTQSSKPGPPGCR
jgi:two-component system cell cycle response regulator